VKTVPCGDLHGRTIIAHRVAPGHSQGFGIFVVK
jgi:hypothetical protein